MKKTILFLLFSIVTSAQSLDATFGYDGVLPEYDNTINSTQVIYDEAFQNNILYQVGYVKRNNLIKGIISKFTPSNDVYKEVGSFALQAICFQPDDKVITAGQNKIYRILTDNNFDTTFNGTGDQTINFGTYPMNIKCISVQTDGKIVVSGYVSNGTNNDFAIARLNVDGSFDTTFDSDGKQTIALGTSNDQAFSHKLQSDGKIVVVGESFITNYDFAVVRLNPNGSLDTVFNGNGKKTIDYSSSIDRARSFEILPDGKIVIFGQIAGAFGCMKLNSDGMSMDNTFGGSGKLFLSDLLSMSTGTTAISSHLIPKIKILSDGKMIVNGTSNSDVKFIKLQADGQSDNTFGINSVVVINNDIDNASSFRFNSSDEILFTGTTNSATSNGNFKIFFGTLSNNGAILTSGTDTIYEENYFKDFQVLPDGSYLNLIAIPYLNIFKLIKYFPDGSIDTSFGVNGSVDMPSFETLSESYINVYSNKIFVSTDTEIYKFNSNGTLDFSFDNDGKIDIPTVLENFDTSFGLNYIDDFKIDNNGNLFIALEIGKYNPSFNVSMGILKLTNNGLVDITFGSNGLFTTRFNSDLNYWEFPRRLLFQNDSKIKIIGLSHNPNITNTTMFCMLRLNTNGSLDTTFGIGGKIMQQLINSGNWPQNSSIFNDDSILCYMRNETNLEFKSIKFLSDGSIDLSHGTNGVTNDVVGTKNFAMAIQSDGKILKAGKKNEQFSISRYNADGSIDTTFGVNGEVNVVSLGIDTAWGFVESSFSKIIIQPDGKIIAGGDSFDGYYQLSTLVRLTNTTLGTLDFNSTKNALSIYPNPIETAATFEFTLENSENITVELYDVQGKLVQTIDKNKEMASGKHNLPIALNANLTSGNYFLKLSTAKGSQTIQIIKK